MPIFIVHCEPSRTDVKSFKTRYSIVAKEIGRGRRPEQISANGSIFYVQTPEEASAFTKRLVTSCGLNREKDRLAVIDVSRGRAFVWGAFDAELKAKFPFLIEECII